MTMVFDEMYGEEINFPDWESEQLPYITARHIIEAVQQHFNN